VGWLCHRAGGGAVHRVVVVLEILYGNHYPMGIPTITVLVLLMGGVQLAAVGVLGEYIGRIYDEVRRRPLYAIDKAFNVQVRDSRGPGSSRRRCADRGSSTRILSSGRK
jgi:hypothetical protein